MTYKVTEGNDAWIVKVDYATYEDYFTPTAGWDRLKVFDSGKESCDGTTNTGAGAEFDDVEGGKVAASTETPTETPTPVTVSLAPTSLELEVSKTGAFVATASSGNVTWASSDAAIATVDNGVVTAVKTGTAIITATSDVDASVSATWTVTVIEA